jgi:hypothetical protein
VISNQTGTVAFVAIYSGEVMLGASTDRILSVCWRELPGREALSVTSTGEVGRPALTSNDVLADPTLIVALAGTINTGRLLDKATVDALVAALLSVTVQVALCPVPRIPGVQLNADNCTGATRFKVNVCVTPPALAVITAV